MALCLPCSLITGPLSSSTKSPQFINTTSYLKEIAGVGVSPAVECLIAIILQYGGDWRTPFYYYFPFYNEKTVSLIVSTANRSSNRGILLFIEINTLFSGVCGAQRPTLQSRHEDQRDILDAIPIQKTV